MKAKTTARPSRAHTSREAAPRPNSTPVARPASVSTQQSNPADSTTWSWELILISVFLLVGFAAIVFLFFVTLYQ